MTVGRWRSVFGKKWKIGFAKTTQARSSETWLQQVRPFRTCQIGAICFTVNANSIPMSNLRERTNHPNLDVATGIRESCAQRLWLRSHEGGGEGSIVSGSPVIPPPRKCGEFIAAG